MFVGLVADRRSLAGPEAARLADGRVFTGAAARDAGLIDELGGVEEAVAWLEAEAGVAADLPLKELSVPRGAPAAVARGHGRGALRRGEFRVLSERLGLDGPLSLWQPFGSQ